MRYRGRRWNNILMLSVIAFIGVLNLPTIIKTYLLEPEPEVASESGFPYLLDPSDQLTAMHFSKWSLVLTDDGWQYQSQGSAQELSQPSAQELSQRWQQLVGTEVDEQTYQSLSASLSLATDHRSLVPTPRRATAHHLLPTSGFLASKELAG